MVSVLEIEIANLDGEALCCDSEWSFIKLRRLPSHQGLEVVLAGFPQGSNNGIGSAFQVFLTRWMIMHSPNTQLSLPFRHCETCFFYKENQGETSTIARRDIHYLNCRPKRKCKKLWKNHSKLLQLKHFNQPKLTVSSNLLAFEHRMDARLGLSRRSFSEVTTEVKPKAPWDFACFGGCFFSDLK